MTLAALQRQFHAAVVGQGATPDGGAVAGFGRGLEVYRNAYRTRLIECLRESFDATWTWLGDEAFTAAACHHLIVHPSQSWTLDDIGRRFDETLAALLPDHPEAADLAWLERAMQVAFSSADAATIPASEFAEMTAGFGEAEWASLNLHFDVGIQTREVASDCVALWNAIQVSDLDCDWALGQPRTVLVWREGLRPQCRLLGEVEARSLTRIRDGASFGELCEHLVTELGSEEGIERAGALLGQWLSDGLLVRQGPADQEFAQMASLGESNPVQTCLE